MIVATGMTIGRRPLLGGMSLRSFVGWRSVENPPAFIPWGRAKAWPHAMTAHWRSRLRIEHGKGV